MLRVIVIFVVFVIFVLAPCARDRALGTHLIVDVEVRVTTSGIHQNLRVTPAMEAGVSDYVWDVEEIVALLG